MPLLIKRILSMLAILAMTFAQVFGWDRGFLCECAGFEKVTLEDHCHGPQAPGGHEEKGGAHCEATEGHRPGDSHEHQAFVESLVASIFARGVLTSLKMPAAALLLPEWYSMSAFYGESSPQIARTEWKHGMRQIWPHVLTRTVVLRI